MNMFGIKRKLKELQNNIDHVSSINDIRYDNFNICINENYRENRKEINKIIDKCNADNKKFISKDHILVNSYSHIGDRSDFMYRNAIELSAKGYELAHRYLDKSELWIKEEKKEEVKANSKVKK